MNYLSLVLRNLARNKRRTILTTLSITVSIFIFASLISLPGLLNQILRDRANSRRLITHSKASLFYMLPESYRRRIESLPHVEAVAAYSVFLATYRDPNEQLGVLAVDNDHIGEIFPDWDISAEADHDFKSIRTAALVATNLMKVYGWKVGQTFMLRGTMYPVDLQLTIVGVLNEEAAGPRIIFRRDYMEELLGRPGTANLFWVKVDSSKSAPEVIAAIDEMFANSPNETATETEVALIKSQEGGTLSLLLNGAKFLAAIVMFTIALVAANTAAMAVRERRHEMAVMRAIGFTRRLDRRANPGRRTDSRRRGRRTRMRPGAAGLRTVAASLRSAGPARTRDDAAAANSSLQLSDRRPNRSRQRLHPRDAGHPR